MLITKGFGSHVYNSHNKGMSINPAYRPVNSWSTVAEALMIGGALGTEVCIPRGAVAVAEECFSAPEAPASALQKLMTPEREEVIVPVSGGMDSTLLYFKYKAQLPSLRAMYCDVGQPYRDAEIDALNALGIEFEYVDCPQVRQEQYWKHIIPARNFVILSHAAEMIRGGRILFGATRNEIQLSGGDESAAFLVGINELFAYLPYPVRVEFPFAQQTKTDMVREWLAVEGHEKILQTTLSCFSPKYEDSCWRHCGACGACLRKWIAFRNNNLDLDTVVPISVGCAESIAYYRRVLRAALDSGDHSHYSRHRCQQDLAALDTID